MPLEVIGPGLFEMSRVDCDALALVDRRVVADGRDIRKSQPTEFAANWPFQGRA